MAVAIPFIVAAAAVVGAGAAIQQGETAKAAANYNVKVNQQNAQLAKQEAEDLAQQKNRETFMRLGSIKAAQGKSGGSGSAGSVLDVLGDAAAQSELDKQYTLYRGAIGERQFTNTAGLDAFTGNQAQSASYLKAGSELLSGAGNYYKADSSLNK
jgi:hypothetical protein